MPISPVWNGTSQRLLTFPTRTRTLPYVPDDPITMAEAAQLLGRHYETIRRYVDNGTLRGWKVGGQWRVSRGECERLLRGEAA